MYLVDQPVQRVFYLQTAAFCVINLHGDTVHKALFALWMTLKRRFRHRNIGQCQNSMLGANAL
jgi:hypothetical protein